MNKTRKEIIENLLKFLCGLAVEAMGTYLEIQAGIGVSAWDCLTVGLSKRLGVLYGTASMMVSVIIVCLDLLLKEKIGLATIVNALVFGRFVDLYSAIGLCPAVEERFWLSCLLIVIGMLIESIGVILYMSPSLGCGPRDTFKVGVGRHLPRVKIGYVGITINSIVLLTGWLLGGPVGLGTVLVIVGYGLAENLVNRIFRFEPRRLKHQNVLETCCILAGKEQKQ